MAFETEDWWCKIHSWGTDISGLLTPEYCSCQGRHHWRWSVSWLPAHTSETVCQLPFKPQRSRLWRLLNISRPSSLTGTDSASEDYLRCALQICASSSSSSSSFWLYMTNHHEFCHKFPMTIAKPRCPSYCSASSTTTIYTVQHIKHYFCDMKPRQCLAVNTLQSADNKH